MDDDGIDNSMMENTGESVEFDRESLSGGEGDSTTEMSTVDEGGSESEGDLKTGDPSIMFQEEEIVPADEESSEFRKLFSNFKAREPKSSSTIEEYDEKPSSASLLSSLLSSLYEEETQRKAEKPKSEEYVYINHVSGSRHIPY